MREEKASLSMKLDTKDKVNWTIEMLSFSTRMREMLTTNFSFTNLSHMSYTDFFQFWHA